MTACFDEDDGLFFLAGNADVHIRELKQNDYGKDSSVRENVG